MPIRPWMKSRASGVATSALVLGWILGFGACSTTQVQPLAILPETPPPYIQVPHPAGLDFGDLLAIFAEKGAPSPDAFKDCDSEFTSLRAKTQSREELLQGARELVRRDPVRYHWCFYSKLYDMDLQLKSAVYLDERQKLVLDRYLFLTPVARAFQVEFNDSRYLRWAVSRYRNVSEHVFFRKVELSPQGAADLAGPVNPFGRYRKSADPQPQGILDKYGILAPAPQPVLEVTHGPAQFGLDAPVEMMDAAKGLEEELGSGLGTGPSATVPPNALDAPSREPATEGKPAGSPDGL